MFADGLTLAPTPLVTEMFPGVINPVPPEKTAVNVELCPTPMVDGLAAKLVMVGAGTTVTVAVAVIADPLDGVTVSVYVVFVVGLTLAPTPLVTEMFPGAITPVPPEKTAVNVELCPTPMADGLAVKLVIVGVTVTVAVAVTAAPADGVTVSVYVVFADGLTLAPAPLVTEMFPGVITPVPPEKTAVNVELCPTPMVDGLAAKLVIAGGVPPPPPPPLFDDPPQPAIVAIHKPSNTAPLAPTTR